MYSQKKEGEMLIQVRALTNLTLVLVLCTILAPKKVTDEPTFGYRSPGCTDDV